MGKSVGQGQRQNVAMKGGQTEYRCQEKAASKRRVWLFIQTRGSPEHCGLMWHPCEDQAGGQPQCHASSSGGVLPRCVPVTAPITPVTTGMDWEGCTEVAGNTYQCNRIISPA